MEVCYGNEHSIKRKAMFRTRPEVSRVHASKTESVNFIEALLFAPIFLHNEYNYFPTLTIGKRDFILIHVFSRVWLFVHSGDEVITNEDFGWFIRLQNFVNIINNIANNFWIVRISWFSLLWRDRFPLCSLRLGKHFESFLFPTTIR